MSEEATPPVQTDGADTAAVLALASGDKTYIGEPEAKPAEAPEDKTDDTPGDDAPAEPEAEPKGDEPKAKKQTVQERIDELTRARREAERDRDFYREQALRGKGDAQPAQEAQPNSPQGDGKPDPTTYEGGTFNPQYIEDLTDWKAEQAVQRYAAHSATERRVTDIRTTFQTQTEKLFPDGPTDGLKAFFAVQTLPAGVTEVIANSDIGPKIAEHLGDNPAELQRLAGLSPALQARELTRLETRLSEPPKATPKTATDAPDPPPRARGDGGQFKVAADTDDFAAFEKQYRIGG